jgi:chromosome segregation ATPase
MRITDFSEVKEAQSKLDSAQSRLSQLQSERSRLPDAIEDLRDRISDAQAEAEVDGRDPDEDDRVQELRDELTAKRERADELEDEIETAKRVVSKLEDRVQKAKTTALSTFQKQADAEAADAVDDALDALEQLREAHERLQELKQKVTPLHNEWRQNPTRLPSPLTVRLTDLHVSDVDFTDAEAHLKDVRASVAA